MIVLEFKTYGKASQFSAMDEALRTVQFIRNKALRFWMDGLGKTQYDLNIGWSNPAFASRLVD